MHEMGIATGVIAVAVKDRQAGDGRGRPGCREVAELRRRAGDNLVLDLDLRESNLPGRKSPQPPTSSGFSSHNINGLSTGYSQSWCIIRGPAGGDRDAKRGMPSLVAPAWMLVAVQP
jgi:hypothetical protein